MTQGEGSALVAAMSAVAYTGPRAVVRVIRFAGQPTRHIEHNARPLCEDRHGSRYVNEPLPAEGLPTCGHCRRRALSYAAAFAA